MLPIEIYDPLNCDAVGSSSIKLESADLNEKLYPFKSPFFKSKQTPFPPEPSTFVEELYPED